jgi:hypothetical protein
MEIREAIERSMSEKRQIFVGSPKRNYTNDIDWLIKEGLMYSVNFCVPNKIMLDVKGPSYKFDVRIIYAN